MRQEIDSNELAVALASATKVQHGPQSRRSPKWSQVVGSWLGKHWLTAARPSHQLTQLKRCNPCLRHSKRCKDAKELKERLTAWSLKVAEYEHQSKASEAQKTFAVREMMPKDIERKFLTGPIKFDEIMEKLEIIINEVMSDDGPVPMD